MSKENKDKAGFTFIATPSPLNTKCICEAMCLGHATASPEVFLVCYCVIRHIFPIWLIYKYMQGQVHYKYFHFRLTLAITKHYDQDHAHKWIPIHLCFCVSQTVHLYSVRSSSIYSYLLRCSYQHPPVGISPNNST